MTKCLSCSLRKIHPLSPIGIGYRLRRRGRGGFLTSLLGIRVHSTWADKPTRSRNRGTTDSGGGERHHQHHRPEHGPRRPEYHQPRPTSTAGSKEQNPRILYVLTLLTDEAHHRTMTALRQLHFPARLNKLSAHVTLFHALPGAHLAEIKRDLKSVAATTSTFAIETRMPPFRMRKGVGIHVSPVRSNDGSSSNDADDNNQIHAIFTHLRSLWLSWLSPQDRDRRSFRPHYTIQNKVDDPAIVDRCFREIETEFPGSTGQVRGLTLYLYDRGWWKWEDEFLFRGA